jgi:hypothetical protein
MVSEKILTGASCLWLNGERHLHDIIADALPPDRAKLDLTTYSISEAGIRALLRLRESDRIGRIRCLIDMRNFTHKFQLCFFFSSFAQLAFASCHAKVTMISSPKTKFTIIGSANLTTNKRYETALITSDKQVFNFYKESFENAFSSAKYLI